MQADENSDEVADQLKVPETSDNPLESAFFKLEALLSRENLKVSVCVPSAGAKNLQPLT